MLCLVDIFTLTLCLLVINFCAALRQSLVSFTKCFIVGLERVCLEAPMFTSSSSSEMDGDSNVGEAIAVIIFYQHF